MGLQCFVRWGFLQDFSPIDAAAAWVTVTGLASELAALGLGSANDLGSKLNKKQQKLYRMMDC